MMRLIKQLRASGESITDDEVARLSPLAFAHVIPNGTYFTQRRSRERASNPQEPVFPLDLETGADT